jgi:hypothetical protein
MSALFVRDGLVELALAEIIFDALWSGVLLIVSFGNPLVKPIRLRLQAAERDDDNNGPLLELGGTKPICGAAAHDRQGGRPLYLVPRSKELRTEVNEYWRALM